MYPALVFAPRSSSHGAHRLVATATCSAHRGREQDGGAELRGVELRARVGFALDLGARLGEPLLSAHWNEADLTTLAAGVDAGGMTLAARGYVALRQLGWITEAEKGLVANDRLRRCIEENVARSLRQACHRRRIVGALLQTWPEQPFLRSDGEWEALRQRLPHVSRAEIRNRTRQIAAFAEEHGHLPSGLFELEPEVRLGRVLLLAAADRQLVHLERRGGELLLTVLLPTTAAPASHRDWSWVEIISRLPPNVPPEADLATPSLRLAGSSLRIDLPFQITVPASRAAGHTRALALDWGTNHVLTGTVGKLVGERVFSDGRPLFYDASGVGVKLGRLRQLGEKLRAKIDRLTPLITGRPQGGDDEQRQMLEERVAVLERERDAVCRRRRNLGHALAWSAARWAVDQAMALGATVIYIEDLATLEGRGMSASVNARVSSTTRGILFDALRHLAAKEGIPVVKVPARGTSALCPHCDHRLRHLKAPDRTRSGWPWAVCPHCGLSCDRDHAASERILARGLLSQQAVVRDRAGTLTVREHQHRDGQVTRARRRRQRRRRPTRQRTPRGHSRWSAADRPRASRAHATRVPAPASAAGQRPAGRVPEDGTPAQAPFTLCGSERGVAHRPRRAPLGRGFHAHVYASPVVHRGDWGPGRVYTAPLRFA